MPALRRVLAAVVLWWLPLAAAGEPIVLQLTDVPEWKAVYGTVEAEDRAPARARLGGTVVDLRVAEGDSVTAGQELARVVDDKLDLQRAALTARQAALQAQRANAEADLARGEELLANGVTTAQRVDALRTQVEVLEGQIAALEAEAAVLVQQAREGLVLAPIAGRVLDVPVAFGAVVTPGEAVVTVAGGETVLRLAVPERHAGALKPGKPVVIATGAGERTAVVSRVYPLIQSGRVLADARVEALPDSFIGARLLVRLAVGTRQALLVPEAAIQTRAGLDIVWTQTPAGPEARTIVPGEVLLVEGAAMVEVISGLQAGDAVLPEGPGHE